MSTDQSLAELTPEATINQITTADKQAGELLASIGLQVSEHKDESLRSVCQQLKWSEVEVLEWITRHSTSTTGKSSENRADTVPAKEAPLEEWFTFLDETYIAPNLTLLGELEEEFPRVRKLHGNQYPWLKHMEWHFNQFRETLGMYYEFERKKLLPLVHRFGTTSKANINHGTIQKIRRAFTVIERDQERLQRLMRTIRDKGNQFKNPDGACSTMRIQNKNFKILFSELNKQFELENEELIPRIKVKIEAQK